MPIKKAIKQNQCPKCGGEEFVTEPNQYDVLTFSARQFEVKHCEGLNDFKIFCRECGVEVEE